MTHDNFEKKNNDEYNVIIEQGIKFEIDFYKKRCQDEIIKNNKLTILYKEEILKNKKLSAKITRNKKYNTVIKNFNKLIAAMAVSKYNFSPKDEKHKAVRDIQNDLIKIGTALDDQTVLKYLKESCESIPIFINIDNSKVESIEGLPEFINDSKFDLSKELSSDYFKWIKENNPKFDIELEKKIRQIMLNLKPKD